MDNRLHYSCKVGALKLSLVLTLVVVLSLGVGAGLALGLGLVKVPSRCTLIPIYIITLMNVQHLINLIINLPLALPK